MFPSFKSTTFLSFFLVKMFVVSSLTLSVFVLKVWDVVNKQVANEASPCPPRSVETTPTGSSHQAANQGSDVSYSLHTHTTTPPLLSPNFCHLTPVLHFLTIQISTPYFLLLLLKFCHSLQHFSAFSLSSPIGLFLPSSLLPLPPRKHTHAHTNTHIPQTELI